MERHGARERADQRLEVDERAGHRSGHARLRPGEQPERQRGAGQRQCEHGDDRLGAGRRRRCALEHERDGQRREAAGAELHGGHGGRVAAGEQTGLEDDEDRRAAD